MRLGVLSDIHGNSIALDAVLADAESLGVKRYLVLGDHVAIGVDPVAVLERLTGLDDVTFVRGNTDRYVVTGEGPPPSLDDAKADPALVAQLTQVTAMFVWTRGYVSAHGWFDWLADLPLEQRLTLPDGTRLLASHASPGRDDGSGFHPGLSNDEMEALITASDVDMVCGSHSHQAVDRRLRAAHVVNPGSVSNPFGPDLRASYAVIDTSEDRYQVFHRRVEYDHDAVIEAIKQSHHPAADFIIGFQRGEHLAWAPHPDNHSVTLGP